MARETSAQKAVRSSVAKVVGSGEAGSKRRSRQAKADVEANAAKVHDINEARGTVAYPDLATITPTRTRDRQWFAKLTPEAQLIVRRAVNERLHEGDSASKAWAAVITETRKASTTEAVKARIDARAAERKSPSAEVRAVAEPETAPESPPATPEPEQATETVVVPRSKRGPRGIEARAESVRLGNKRGSGKKVTDDELAAYVVEVRKAHPDSSRSDEMEHAYWIEKMALGFARWNKAWADADAQVKQAS